MKEKLILEPRAHCPYCWTDLTNRILIANCGREVSVKFTITTLSRVCNCGEWIDVGEEIWNPEPSPQLWARRFNEVMG